MPQTWTTQSRRRQQTALAIFAPGRFFRGASSRSTVEGWRQRLQGYLSA